MLTKLFRNYRFQPRLAVSLAALAGVAVTLALASWQLSRAQEKKELAARLGALAKDPPVALPAAEVAAGDVLWRRVTVRGRFEPRHAVFIDNRVRQGIAGYHVVMPLAIGGGNRYVLVNRGWVARSAERARLPEVRTPGATVEITGLAVVPSTRFLELSTRTVEGKVWQNLTLERYRQAVPIALQPVVVQQESALDDGLIREWDPPDFGIKTHHGYAFQWFALAVTILIFYLAAHVRRRPE